jgi:hypothetical protein
LGLLDLALIWELLDGKSEVKDAKEEEEKAVVVGEKEASGSGEKATATANLLCTDWLREELSCAVKVVLWFRFDRSTCNCMLYGLGE